MQLDPAEEAAWGKIHYALMPMQKYFAAMPWAAADRKAWPEAASRFGVQGIPRLVMIGAEGNIINEDALQQVRKDPKGTDFPWPENLNPK